ncbi:hypothetical protein J2T18_003564 [Paenibacillus polymyxa]|nr:hypothetical protein [Paenibacillus polymyxa]
MTNKRTNSAGFKAVNVKEKRLDQAVRHKAEQSDQERWPPNYSEKPN